MRIGINALYLIPGEVGGTEPYLRSLLRALQGVDHDNDYVVYTNRENAGTFALRSPRFREAKGVVAARNRPARILWEQSGLALQVRRDAIDVLHSPGYTAPLLPGCRSVVTIHDLNYHYHPEDWSRLGLLANRALVPAAARLATRIVTPSRCSKAAIVRLLDVPEPKVEVVYSGVDDNLPPPAPEAETRERLGLPRPFLLTVSATHPHKNLDGLLDAYARVCRSRADAPDLVIAGARGTHHDRIASEVSAWPGPGRVLLTGWLSGEHLSALYRAAVALVFPSRYEGFGFPLVEAMRAGIPVASSSAASLAEIAGDAALLFDPDRPDDMAAAILRLLDDGALREQLVARGRSRVDRFTWRAAALRTLDVYRRAVAEP